MILVLEYVISSCKVEIKNVKSQKKTAKSKNHDFHKYNFRKVQKTGYYIDLLIYKTKFNIMIYYYKTDLFIL